MRVTPRSPSIPGSGTGVPDDPDVELEPDVDVEPPDVVVETPDVVVEPPDVVDPLKVPVPDADVTPSIPSIP